MNTNALSTPVMLHLTHDWLSDAGFRSALQQSGSLGVGVLGELDKAHGRLAELQRNRGSIKSQLRALIERAAALDRRHDRKARGLHGFLSAIVESADDDATIRKARALLELLFPIGLRVTQLSFAEKNGAAVALEPSVTPAVRVELAAITGGSLRLDVLFDEWMAAARELGRAVHDRVALVVRSARHGTDGKAFDVRAARSRWIRAIRGLLWNLDVEPELALVREAVHAVLIQSITATHRRSSASARFEAELEAELEPEVEPEVEAEIEAEIEAEVEPELEADAPALDEHGSLDQHDALAEHDSLDVEIPSPNPPLPQSSA